MQEAILRFIEHPVFAICLCLLLGAIALSARSSLIVANFLLAGVWGVGTLQIARSVREQPRLMWGGILMLAGFCFIVSYWVKPPTVKPPIKAEDSPPPEAQNSQVRQDLYVKLSGQKEERAQLYGEEWFIQLKFITADAEAANKNLSATIRQEKAGEAKKQLDALDAIRQGSIAQHQREFAETIAQIRLAFPKDKELDQLLSSAAPRPLYDIQNPPCDDTRNIPCMQAWANVEAKKAETATNRTMQRVVALMAYMEAHRGY